MVWTLIPCDKAKPPVPRETASFTGAIGLVKRTLLESARRYACKDRLELPALTEHSGSTYTSTVLVPESLFASLRELEDGVKPLVLLPPGVGEASVANADAVVFFYDSRGNLKGLPANERASLLCKACSLSPPVDIRGDAYIGRVRIARWDSHAGAELALGGEASAQFMVERSWLEAAQRHRRQGGDAAADRSAADVEATLAKALEKVPLPELTKPVKAAASTTAASTTAAQARVAPAGAVAAPLAVAVAPAAATSDGGCASDCCGAESVGEGCMDAGSVSWENRDAEVEVTITVPERTKSKDVTVSIKDQWLCVGVGTLAGEHAARPLIDGQLFQRVKPLDSDWTFEDVKGGGRPAFFVFGHTPFSPYVAPRFSHMSEINSLCSSFRRLVITLEKETKMRWFELIRGKGTAVLDKLVV